jgi:hypothetical protein
MHRPVMAGQLITSSSVTFRRSTAPHRTQDVRTCPSAAGALDRIVMAAIEGTTDQMWFSTVVDRRAEAAAGNAMARVISFPVRRAWPGMTNQLGSMRRHGVRGLFVIRQHCGHERAVNMDDWSDDATVPSFDPPMRCSRCGELRATAVPNWIERAEAVCLRSPLSTLPAGIVVQFSATFTIIAFDDSTCSGLRSATCSPNPKTFLHLPYRYATAVRTGVTRDTRPVRRWRRKSLISS